MREATSKASQMSRNNRMIFQLKVIIISSVPLTGWHHFLFTECSHANSSLTYIGQWLTSSLSCAYSCWTLPFQYFVKYHLTNQIKRSVHSNHEEAYFPAYSQWYGDSFICRGSEIYVTVTSGDFWFSKDKKYFMNIWLHGHISEGVWGKRVLFLWPLKLWSN